jgi:GNAT superfamily N-acetyltransferase
MEEAAADVAVAEVAAADVAAAEPADVEKLLALRDDAARWLLSRGINQWHPGELPQALIDDQVALGCVFVVRHAGELVATVTLTFEDAMVWGTAGETTGGNGDRDGDGDEDCGYVHRLIVDRRWAGHRVGSALLAWAENRTAESGRLKARLDCVRSNRHLRRYYETAGYRLVGYKDFPAIAWAPETALYEKALVFPA